MRITTLALLFMLFTTSLARAGSDADASEPSFTIATDPIALAYETFTLSLTRRASSHVALRADIEYTPDAVAQLGGGRLGASVPIYLDRTFHGPYVEPGVFLARDRALAFDGLGGLGYGETSEVAGTSIAVGWQKTFGSGFTIQAAFGAERVRTNAFVTTTPTSYLRVGYAW